MKNTGSDIADWFLTHIDREAGDVLTHLKLQKLVYYAQAWSLALLGHSLIEEDFQAWAHGPCLPSLWQRFGNCGWEALPEPDSVPDLPENVRELLGEVLEVYGNLSAKYLEELVCNEDPWTEARDGLPPEMRSENIISKQTMADYYKKLYQRMNKSDGQKAQTNIAESRQPGEAAYLFTAPEERRERKKDSDTHRIKTGADFPIIPSCGISVPISLFLSCG